jgi:hypothetical protein
MLKDLAPGEVVTATRIDRLARSTFDLFAIVKRIVDAGGQFRSLAEPWADTSTSTGRSVRCRGGLTVAEIPLCCRNGHIPLSRSPPCPGGQVGEGVSPAS